MECKIKNRHELIANYLVGELPEDEARAFEEHYFQCETCFKELKIAEDAINIIAKKGNTIFKPEAHRLLAETESQSSEDKNSKIIIHKLIFPGLSSPKRWGIAFAAIAVMVLALFLTLLNDQEVLNDKVITKNKETLPENKDNPLAVDTISEKDNSPLKNDFAELRGIAFKPVPYLEEWITENVRSQNDIIDTVFSPQIGEKFKDEGITFSGEMTERKAVSLKIMSNLEEEIYKSVSEEDQFPKFTIQITPEIFKQSGLYYWRIEDENEVLYVGKFYFMK